MMLRHKNLLEMGSSFSKQKLITLITSSLPNLYRPTLQTLTAADRASKLKQPSTLSGVATQTITTTLAGMSLYELMDYFIEEAEHHIIEDNWAKQMESAMQAQAKKKKGRANKGKSHKLCVNCDKSGDEPGILVWLDTLPFSHFSIFHSDADLPWCTEPTRRFTWARLMLDFR